MMLIEPEPELVVTRICQSRRFVLAWIEAIVLGTVLNDTWNPVLGIQCPVSTGRG